MAEKKKDILEGKKAPAFALRDAEGQKRELGDYRGRWLVLYFYPKDNTSGCTREAVDFTSLRGDFARLGAEVAGVSPDSQASHGKFIEKQNLTITLLSDEERKTLEKYGVWQKKSLYGREYFGVERSTFLINGEGKIRRVWRKVKVPGHASEVLGVLKELVQEG